MYFSLGINLPIWWAKDTYQLMECNFRNVNNFTVKVNIVVVITSDDHLKAVLFTTSTSTKGSSLIPL